MYDHKHQFTQVSVFPSNYWGDNRQTINKNEKKENEGEALSLHLHRRSLAKLRTLEASNKQWLMKSHKSNFLPNNFRLVSTRWAIPSKHKFSFISQQTSMNITYDVHMYTIVFYHSFRSSGSFRSAVIVSNTLRDTPDVTTTQQGSERIWKRK